MNYTDCITALQEYADAPESAGVDNEFFINVGKFVKEQEEQIKLQVCMKENENTKRIKLERENKELKTSNQQYICMFNAVVESEGEQVDKIDKLEEEIKELEASLLTWKMSRALRDTEIKELQEQVKTLQYQLKDEVAGWSPTSSDEPKMNN